MYATHMPMTPPPPHDCFPWNFTTTRFAHIFFTAFMLLALHISSMGVGRQVGKPGIFSTLIFFGGGNKN
jgi:hypothetical protein